MEIHQLEDGSKTFQRPKQLAKIVDHWLSEQVEGRQHATPMMGNYETLRKEAGVEACDITMHQSLLGCIRLRAYADAAYGCMKDGRSKLAYDFDLVPVDDPDVDTEQSARIDTGTGMFFSESKISDTASCMSSTEAEHSSVVECVKTLVMYRGILEEIHQEQL
jgi:hypothetical protein